MNYWESKLTISIRKRHHVSKKTAQILTAAIVGEAHTYLIITCTDKNYQFVYAFVKLKWIKNNLSD